MKSSELMVDESMATELLTKNRFYDRTAEGRTNRPVSKIRVAQYAGAMLRGEWKLTHQGLALDTNGSLVDGQHRLMALQQAATTDPDIKIPFMLYEDVEPEIFEVIDTGNVRSGKDILALQGEKDTLHLHAALRHLFLFQNVEHFQWARTRVTNHQIREMLENNPNLREDVSLAKSFQTIGWITTSASVCLYACRQADPSRMEEFVDGIRTGASLEQGDPRLALRNYLVRGKTMNSMARRYDATKIQMAIGIKTWNDFMNGQRREIVRWAYSEDFPKPKPPTEPISLENRITYAVED